MLSGSQPGIGGIGNGNFPFPTDECLWGNMSAYAGERKRESTNKACLKKPRSFKCGLKISCENLLEDVLIVKTLEVKEVEVKSISKMVVLNNEFLIMILIFPN